MLTDFAKTLIQRFPLGNIATIDAQGRPCVSPKGTFLVLDDTTLGFANIRSPGTLANLAHRAECEVVFVDPFLRKGLRIRATTQTHTRGSAEFERLAPDWAAIWPALAPRIGDLVILTVTKASPLSTPPYDHGATEADMIAHYKSRYAEIYP